MVELCYALSRDGVVLLLIHSIRTCNIQIVWVISRMFVQIHKLILISLFFLRQMYKFIQVCELGTIFFKKE